MFAPTTKYERISGASALDDLDKSIFPSCGSPCCVGLVVRFFHRKCGKANKSGSKCVGQKYCMSEDLARAAELQAGSTVCRDEILRSNNRCSVPGELNHSRGLRKQPNPARLFAVLDAIGATCHGYKPGTRCGYKCCTRVDEETRFTSHPDYRPPVLRATEKAS